MGRIKTQFIKRVTNDLVSAHSDKFKKDFEENKKLVSQFADISSKKLRNVIAGYVTRLMKRTE
ncbi:30S ribosomal protein S17e [Candidatus Woesearchaeota archaeon]|nr:30S ribosomal protein S17e [Candidatus Woesearchaeota archaeon]